ncbi:MAG: helix-turn-helix transcriptional regulator [Anaerolineales bacterium]|nr:helix-turn-helix transcriptional regulator [Anaerolineales bacterium]
MVNYSNQLDLTFSAISDPTRRAILSQLAQGDASIMDLASPHAMSLPAITKHIRVLETAGLLTRRKKGRVNYCHLNASPLREAGKWVVFYQRFWNTKLDALEKFLEENPE